MVKMETHDSIQVQCRAIRQRRNIRKTATYPDGRCHKRRHTLFGSWLLSLLCQPLVHTVPKPDIRPTVPTVKQDFEALGSLDGDDVDVSHSVPEGPSGL